jgi:cytochrome P450
VLGDRPDIREQLREDRSLIPIFIEECLRMDSPVRSVFRMARKTTTLGDTRCPRAPR